MDHLPVFLTVKGRRVVVAGGGLQAARKVDLLVRAGCRPVVIAPTLDVELARFAGRGDIEHRAGPVTAEDLAGCAIAIGASDDSAVNRRLHALATAAGVPVNIVDQPALCDFILPALVDRAPVLVAVSSGGAAPLLTRALKARFETMIPSAYGGLAEFAGEYRDRVKRALPDSGARRRFWEEVIGGPIAEQLFSGQKDTAKSLLERRLKESGGKPVGEVYLVGAGPGDPDLLTFRALRLMQQADVVLYDRLIGDGVLNLVRRDAERVFVGKQPKNHTVAQDKIGEMLVRLASQGKRVLRLKGGDPFIFGRGGEEIEALAREGIAFQVVPGVTAASGCAAYAGIPLTHRDHAQSCVFVTGHAKEGPPDLDWHALIQPRQTIVVYMGLSSLNGITDAYIAHGGDGDTPAAVVENGTRPDQRVLTGTVGTLPAAAAEAGLQAPALIIIGGVVTLREGLNWYAGIRRSPADEAIRANTPLPVIASEEVWNGSMDSYRPVDRDV